MSRRDDAKGMSGHRRLPPIPLVSQIVHTAADGDNRPTLHHNHDSSAAPAHPARSRRSSDQSHSLAHRSLPTVGDPFPTVCNSKGVVSDEVSSSLDTETRELLQTLISKLYSLEEASHKSKRDSHRTSYVPVASALDGKEATRSAPPHKSEKRERRFSSSRPLHGIATIDMSSGTPHRDAALTSLESQPLVSSWRQDMAATRQPAYLAPRERFLSSGDGHQQKPLSSLLSGARRLRDSRRDVGTPSGATSLLVKLGNGETDR